MGFLGFKNANLKQMSFQELNPWTPAPAVWNLAIDLSENGTYWKIHYKITCEFYPRFYPHKRVFLGFWIAKTHELPGGSAPRPLPGDGVTGGQCMTAPWTPPGALR